jgi:hypothetical protein
MAIQGSSLFQMFSSLKRVVPVALDRAIREIIGPVVERSSRPGLLPPANSLHVNDAYNCSYPSPLPVPTPTAAAPKIKYLVRCG